MPDEIVYVGDADVTDEWFEPLTPIRNDVPAEDLFVRKWKEYGIYENDNHGTWCHRVELIVDVPGGNNLLSGRVATSFFRWFGTNIGSSFLQRTLHNTRLDPSFNNGHNKNLLLSAWAVENIRRDGQRRLNHILGVNKLEVIHFEIAEQIMLWLASDDGRRFFALAFQELDWRVTWMTPKEKIAGFE